MSSTVNSLKSRTLNSPIREINDNRSLDYLAQMLELPNSQLPIDKIWDKISSASLNPKKDCNYIVNFETFNLELELSILEDKLSRLFYSGSQ